MAGHEVVRLPVAHCTLYPIEHHIKANTSFDEVERLAIPI